MPVREEKEEPAKETGDRTGTGFPQFKVVDKIDLSVFEKHPKKGGQAETAKPQPEAEEKETPAEQTAQAAPAAPEQDGVPQADLERFARFLLPKIQAFYQSEEGQRLFEEWKAKQ